MALTETQGRRACSRLLGRRPDARSIVNSSGIFVSFVTLGKSLGPGKVGLFRCAASCYKPAPLESEGIALVSCVRRTHLMRNLALRLVAATLGMFAWMAVDTIRAVGG
jgi:hypothetical protein